MKDDPIVDEVRKAGEAYLAKFQFDLRAAFEDLNRRTVASGVRAVSRPPKPPRTRPTARNQVG